MDIKLEKALIRTFRKIREMYDENGDIITNKILQPNELCGIFINFCYSEYGVHNGLNTEYISMCGSGSEGWKIWFNNKNQYYRTEFSKLVEEALNEVQDYEFYSMWLRSSFENPKEDGWSHPIVREALKEYKGISDSSHYDKYKEEQEVKEIFNSDSDYNDNGYGHCYNDAEFWYNSYTCGRITYEHAVNTIQKLLTEPLITQFDYTPKKAISHVLITVKAKEILKKLI